MGESSNSTEVLKYRRRWRKQVTQQRVNKPPDLSFWLWLHETGRNGKLLRESIESGPFRQFYECASRMDFKSICFPGNGVLKDLGAEVTLPGVKDDEMWFIFAGALHRSGKQEFALVTGLKFGVSDINVKVLENEPVNGKNIVARLFPDAKRFHVCGLDVQKLLDNQMRRLDAEDVEKLYLVLVAYHFLLGQSMTKVISNFIWHLVDDVERFKAFPWGSYVYAETVKDFKSKLGGTFFNNPIRGVHLYGFPLAFVWWMVDCFPDVRAVSRVTKLERDEDDESLYPRCVKWNFEDNSSKRFDLILQVPGETNLVPSEAERNSWYFKCCDFEVDMSDSKREDSEADSEMNMQEYIIKTREKKWSGSHDRKGANKILGELKRNIEDLVQWRREMDEWRRKVEDLLKARCNEIQPDADVKSNRVSVRPITIKEASIKKNTPKMGRKKRKAPGGGTVLATLVKTRKMVRDELKKADIGKATPAVVDEASTKEVKVDEKVSEIISTLPGTQEVNVSPSKPRFGVQTRTMARKETISDCNIEENNGKGKDDQLKNAAVPDKETNEKDVDDQVKNDLAIAKVLSGLVGDVGESEEIDTDTLLAEEMSLKMVASKKTSSAIHEPHEWPEHKRPILNDSSTSCLPLLDKSLRPKQLSTKANGLDEWLNAEGELFRFVDHHPCKNTIVREILSCTTWFSGELINIFLHCIKKLHSGVKNQKVGVLSSFFYSALSYQYMEALKKKEGLKGLFVPDFWIKIINGQALEDFNCSPWWELDTICFPAHLYDTHWAIVVLDLTKQEIWVVDSRCNKCGNDQQSWELLANQFKCVAYTIPQILSMSKYYSHKPPVLDREWRVHHPSYNCVPCQPNSHACGAYICVGIEDILLGRKKWSVNRERGWPKLMRQHIANVIFQATKYRS